jgi:hypothetical protein
MGRFGVANDGVLHASFCELQGTDSEKSFVVRCKALCDMAFEFRCRLGMLVANRLAPTTHANPKPDSPPRVFLFVVWSLAAKKGIRGIDPCSSRSGSLSCSRWASPATCCCSPSSTFATRSESVDKTSLRSFDHAYLAHCRRRRFLVHLSRCGADAPRVVLKLTRERHI